MRDTFQNKAAPSLPFINSKAGAPVLQKEKTKRFIFLWAQTASNTGFLSLRFGSCRKSHVSLGRFPNPPRLFTYLTLKGALYGSNAAIDRCDINGLLCKACCCFKCILITPCSSGTEFPGFQRDTRHCTGDNVPRRATAWPHQENIFR